MCMWVWPPDEGLSQARCYEWCRKLTAHLRVQGGQLSSWRRKRTMLNGRDKRSSNAVPGLKRGVHRDRTTADGGQHAPVHAASVRRHSQHKAGRATTLALAAGPLPTEIVSMARRSC